MGKALITRRGGSSDPISALLDGEKYGIFRVYPVNYQYHGGVNVSRCNNENLGVLAFGIGVVSGDYACVIAIDWTSQAISVIKSTLIITPQIELMDSTRAVIRVWGSSFDSDNVNANGVYFYPA